MESQQKELLQEEDITFYQSCKAIATSFFMLLFIELIIIYVLSIIFLSLQFDIQANDINSIMNLIATIIATLFVVKYYSKTLKFKIKYDKITKHYSIQKFLLFIIVTLGISSLFTIGINVINEALHQVSVDLTTPDFRYTPSLIENIVLILTTCVVAPIFEELLFRGIILSALKRYGFKFAILTSALLFALMHGNFIQAIPTFVLGIFFAYIVLKTHSLYASIILHFINNALAMVTIAFVGNEVVSMMLLLFELVCMVIAIFVVFKKRDNVKHLITLKEKYKVRNFFNNWIAILYLVIILFVFLFTIVFI